MHKEIDFENAIEQALITQGGYLSKGGSHQFRC